MFLIKAMYEYGYFMLKWSYHLVNSIPENVFLMFLVTDALFFSHLLFEEQMYNAIEVLMTVLILLCNQWC